MLSCRLQNTSAATASPGAPPRSGDGTDILQVLVFSRILTTNQVEPARRTAKVKGISIEQAIVELGTRDRSQMAEALARYTGLRFVKINPLDLDLDVVTTALSGPFARRHGLIAISKNATTLTVALHDPLAPFPMDDIRRVTGLDVERVVATRSDVEALNRAFYGLKTSLKSAEKQLASSWLTADLGNQEFLSAESEELDPGGRAGCLRAGSYSQLRVRTARLGHPFRAEAGRDARAIAHRRSAARSSSDPEDRVSGDRVAHQTALGMQHRREAPSSGRPDQARAGRARNRAARLDDADGIRRKSRVAHLRSGRSAEARR